MGRIRGSVALVGGIVGFLALAGCQQHQAPMADKGPPEVFVSTPVSQEITDYEEFSGRLEANETIQIRARVTGYLLKYNFKEGGQVNKGDVLFEIDPPLYEAQLALAEGSVMEAQGQYEQAKSDWTRVQKLRIGVETSEEERNKFRGAYVMSEGKLKAAKAQLKIAQVNMGYTHVVAPISGRISRTMVDPGNLVKADDTVLTGIGSLTPIKAYFDVDERTVLRILALMDQGIVPKDPTGVSVEMGLANEEGRPHKGTIDFFDTYVDPSTGTLRVRGTFDNADGLLVPGMFVRVRLPIGKPQEATFIAEKSLVTDQGQKFVYVVKEENTAEHLGKVEYRKVKLGRLHEGLRVVKEGVAANEKVVVSGLQRVRPDIQVKFKDTPMPVTPGSAESPDPSKVKPVTTGPSTLPRGRDGPAPAGAPKGHKGTDRGKKGH